MSKLINFILFNGFMYAIYKSIDKVLTFLGVYSNPKLGEELSVMPTNWDIAWIVCNTLISGMLTIYILYKIKTLKA